MFPLAYPDIKPPVAVVSTRVVNMLGMLTEVTRTLSDGALTSVSMPIMLTTRVETTATGVPQRGFSIRVC